MAVTTTLGLYIEQHHYQYPGLVLPEGKNIQSFYAGPGTATGDASAGQAIAYVRFNPNDDRVFQKWVTITGYGCRSQTAQTAGGLALSAENGDWEKWKTAGASQHVTEFYNIGTSTSVAGYAGAIPFGRIEKGTTGQLRIECTNTNTASMRFWATGFLTDFPVVLSSTRRA